MTASRRARRAALAAHLPLLLAACDRPAGAGARVAGDESAAAAARPPARVAIAAVMADPVDVPDERGEWILLRNGGSTPVSLRGWTLASASDPARRIDAAVTIAAGDSAVLARDGDASRNGGVRAIHAYGGGIALGNGEDWLAVRDPAGRTTDSVWWTGASRGIRMAGAALRRARPAAAGTGGSDLPGRAPTPGQLAGSPRGSRALVVRVLDVGQGDAILAENGGSRVLIDGGVDPAALGRHLDALGLDGDTIDVVVVTHPHLDHYNGLREVLRARRRIAVRYVFDAQDPSPNSTLAALRDSIRARARRGQLQYRDADDPCGDGRASCRIVLRGGAVLEVFRPYPGADASPNDRSVPVRLLGADTAAFSMWLAGDAEHGAIAWMMRQGYPMRSRVLKANHHGSCDGVTEDWVRRVRPELVVASLAAQNDYGYVHAQTKAILRRLGVPWLRTDQNGTVVLRAPGTPGSAYTVEVERGARSPDGPMDRVSRQDACRGMG